jgi:hypothetical protein
MSFDTFRHVPAQFCKPALHVKPQLVPSHVGVAFAGAAHGVHELPHVLTERLSLHAPPHW